MSMLERSMPLLGADGIEKLNKSSVIVFGVGGVGSWCVEALARCGVGKITVVDGDIVSETNRNRQLVALSSTVGRSKPSVCVERLKDINPNGEFISVELFYSAETKDEIDLSEYDFIADCIDDSLLADVGCVAYIARMGRRSESAYNCGVFIPFSYAICRNVRGVISCG